MSAPHDTKPDQAGQDQASTGESKRVATLQALLAIRGFSLQRQEDGSYSVERWGVVKALQDINSVERFLRQIGGGHA